MVHCPGSLYSVPSGGGIASRPDSRDAVAALTSASESDIAFHRAHFRERRRVLHLPEMLPQLIDLSDNQGGELFIQNHFALLRSLQRRRKKKLLQISRCESIRARSSLLDKRLNIERSRE